ncbi:MAG TPA: efflux RND transporter permease subunit, partial [Gammaproteobacteria bacterium]|nr:efflux RND transporter permease subunit [Gammaproteobacteria bacterium]
VGMLVDNTIVMLENIYRHQLDGESGLDTGTRAAAEVQSAIIASTSTNLAAILPFLFISGMIGLLFRELIVTVSSAIVASMLIALTLVPALAARVPLSEPGKLRLWLDKGMDKLRHLMGNMTNKLLHSRLLRLLLITSMLAALVPATQTFFSVKQDFLPKMDEGRISIYIRADTGVTLDVTDGYVKQLESIAARLPFVQSIFTTSGGYVFGRSQYESQNNASLIVQLSPLSERKLSSYAWIKKFNKIVEGRRLAGVSIRAHVSGIRGIPLGRGSDEISLRVQGSDPDTLDAIAGNIVTALHNIDDIRNITSSSEEQRQEIKIEIDRERAATLGLSAEQIGEAIRLAVTGLVISDYFEGGHSFDIRIKLPEADVNRIDLLKSVLIEHTGENRQPVYLADVARIHLIRAAPDILRENQQRFVEVSASLKQGISSGEIEQQVQNSLRTIVLPEGYGIYDAGISKTLQEGRDLSAILLGLALFLVFTAMAIQYESLTNPLVILLGIPFTMIGVTIGLKLTGLNLSMPVWLGLIMLAGIVVNNAIVLLEYIELQRKQGLALNAAITEAVRLRLRPILMTTLTTIVGLTPLANAWGDGGEMLKPLAVTIISGLSFSLLVSLVMIPVLYQLFHIRR